MKRLRKIIQIDEEKCNGCGACITSCAEGALALVNGKARLVKEQYCDGLAACLQECPQGALTIVEKKAEDFDEGAVKEYLEAGNKPAPEAACSCPGSAVRQFARPVDRPAASPEVDRPSMLTHWPVQLALVPPGAKFLNDTDVVLVADCVPFAYPHLHRDFLAGHSVLVACPKLDDAQAHLDKLTAILRQSHITSLTVVHMEVPCCSGLVYIARRAITESGRNIPFKEITVGIKGEIQ
jgi:Pyruvate/2-oxoacid:ferredoxin oxidoreductase delta subunit